jgi:hypothetical protein
MDPDDSGNAYLMDPDVASNADKAYAYFPISDPKTGLLARWHDYFGSAADNPDPSVRFYHGAIFLTSPTDSNGQPTLSPVTSFQNGLSAGSQRVLRTH